MSDTHNLNSEEQELWQRMGFSTKKVIQYALWLEEALYRMMKDLE